MYVFSYEKHLNNSKFNLHNDSLFKEYRTNFQIELRNGKKLN